MHSQIRQAMQFRGLDLYSAASQHALLATFYCLSSCVFGADFRPFRRSDPHHVCHIHEKACRAPVNTWIVSLHGTGRAAVSIKKAMDEKTPLTQRKVRG